MTRSGKWVRWTAVELAAVSAAAAILGSCLAIGADPAAAVRQAPRSSRAAAASSDGPSATKTAGAGDPSAAAPSEQTQEILEQATFGSGCFWCTEAVFQELKGIREVVSGYSGGAVPQPTYYQVGAGFTGHAEVVQITYDPRIITYEELLEVFWKTHDPTTPNRQGPDVGTQYRSVIFYHNDQQRKLAEHYKQKLTAARAFRGPVVTEIAPLTAFYPAEIYHQDYFSANPRQAYCRSVIRPKVEKVRKVFKDKLKTAPEPEARGTGAG